LNKNEHLHFALLRLQLIELIRAGFKSANSKSDTTGIAKAIEFAQQNLAPYASVSKDFQKDLERAMALLIVPHESWSKPLTSSSPQAAVSDAATAPENFGQLAELVDPSLRQKVAKDVNEAILASQGQRREANIRHLVRTRAWAEKVARDKNVDLPAQLSLGLDGEQPTSSGGDTEMATDNGAT
jgi:glucose-induced degradation protein 8